MNSRMCFEIPSSPPTRLRVLRRMCLKRASGDRQYLLMTVNASLCRACELLSSWKQVNTREQPTSACVQASWCSKKCCSVLGCVQVSCKLLQDPFCSWGILVRLLCVLGECLASRQTPEYLVLIKEIFSCVIVETSAAWERERKKKKERERKKKDRDRQTDLQTVRMHSR